MTTIAWDGVSLAGDTLVSGADCGREYTDKVFMVSGDHNFKYFGGAGPLQDTLAVRDWLERGAKREDKPSVSDNFRGLLVDKNNNLYCLEGKLVPLPVANMYYAIGSGAGFAVGAMLYAASIGEPITARTAIDFASVHDIHTGGRIVVLPTPLETYAGSVEPSKRVVYPLSSAAETLKPRTQSYWPHDI